MHSNRILNTEYLVELHRCRNFSRQAFSVFRPFALVCLGRHFCRRELYKMTSVLHSVVIVKQTTVTEILTIFLSDEGV